MYKKALRGIRYYEIEPKMSLVLEYYVIEQIIGSGQRCYGIEIEERKVGGLVEQDVEVKHLLLSECKDWVEDLVGKLIGGGVTLVTMDCVIDGLM